MSISIFSDIIAYESPESPMRAHGIISTTKATRVVVFHVPLNGQVVPVVAHVALKHVTTF